MEESMVMPTLIIDPEFETILPALNDEDFNQLKENILGPGEVFEPIVLWNGVIVDGHNRYRIIQEHPEIKWRTRNIEFNDRWEAIQWMIRNQIGKRNLTEQERYDLIGRHGIARQHIHGGDRRSEEFSSGKSFPLKNEDRENSKTSDEVGKEYGITGRTVRSAISYARGIDAIREQDPDVAKSILKGETNAQKKDIMKIAKAKEEERAQLIEEIKKRKNQARKISKDKPREMVAGTKENKELNDSISASIAELYDTETKSEYTLDMFLTVIRMGAERYAKSLRDDLEFHKDLLEDAINRDAIATTIQESIIDEIEKIKESIENA